MNRIKHIHFSIYVLMIYIQIVYIISEHRSWLTIVFTKKPHDEWVIPYVRSAFLDVTFIYAVNYSILQLLYQPLLF